MGFINVVLLMCQYGYSNDGYKRSVISGLVWIVFYIVSIEKELINEVKIN